MCFIAVAILLSNVNQLIPSNYFTSAQSIEQMKKSKLVQDITLNSDIIKLNTPIQFNVVLDKLKISQLEFQLWLSYENEPWKIVIPYQSWPFAPIVLPKVGSYSLQIDVRNKFIPEIVEKYWLGNVSSEPIAETKLVESISWRPFTVSPPIGTELDFVINTGGSNSLNDLEFELWTKKEDDPWEIVNKYQSWPIPSYTFREEGLHSLQVNIRNKKNSTQLQKIWLGQYYPHDKNRKVNSDYLIRRILANYPSPNVDESSFLKPIIYELNLAVNMMYWDYKNLSMNEQENRLKSLTGIRATKRLGKGKYDINIQHGESRSIDLLNGNIESEYLGLNIQMDGYPNVEKVFQSTIDLPEEMQIAATMTYLLYVNYLYSQVPFSIERPRSKFYSTIAHCENYAVELNDIMGILGYNIRALSLSYVSTAAHALNEVRFGKSKYILDATSGVVYQVGIDEIQKKYMQPIVLPQVRDLDFIWSQESWDELEVVSELSTYGVW